MTLMSLSSSDYPDLLPLCDALLEWCEPHKVNLALPSLRADNFSMNLMEKLQRGGRKSGLTFAPEAGSQRLRDAINKNVTEEDLLNSCRTAFAGGWSGVKLYFMLGLPTETDEDVLGIADLANKVYHVWRNNTPNRSRGGADYRFDLLFCAQISYPISVGGAEYKGGISAKGNTPPRESAEQIHYLQLARPGDQFLGGGAFQGGPPGGGCD